MKRRLLVAGLAILMVGAPISALVGGQLIEARASAWRQIDPQTLPQCAVPAAPAWRRMESGT